MSKQKMMLADPKRALETSINDTEQALAEAERRRAAIDIEIDRMKKGLVAFRQALSLLEGVNTDGSTTVSAPTPQRAQAREIDPEVLVAAQKGRDQLVPAVKLDGLMRAWNGGSAQPVPAAGDELTTVLKPEVVEAAQASRPGADDDVSLEAIADDGVDMDAVIREMDPFRDLPDLGRLAARLAVLNREVAGKDTIQIGDQQIPVNKIQVCKSGEVIWPGCGRKPSGKRVNVLTHMRDLEAKLASPAASPRKVIEGFPGMADKYLRYDALMAAIVECDVSYLVVGDRKIRTDRVRYDIKNDYLFEGSDMRSCSLQDHLDYLKPTKAKIEAELRALQDQARQPGVKRGGPNGLNAKINALTVRLNKLKK